MFASCAIATGTGTPFLSGNRLLSTGTSRSSSTDKMSFTGTSSPSPSWVTIKAFADTATNSSSRRRIEATKPPSTANLYEILRVKESASQVEIKTAYRNLAKLYHPDAVAATSDSDARDFIEINKAYATLSDPTARARYDLSITARRGFSSYSSSSAPGIVVGRTRRWETDQCW